MPHTLPHLPHLHYDGVLFMGLSRLDPTGWIETDAELPQYLHHKHQQRAERGAGVYRATADSLPAQREFAQLLRTHLTQDQPTQYQLQGEQLHYLPTHLPLPAIGAEPLWDCSCWVADDLVIMEERDGQYHLTAASLCSPSHWSLADKFDRPMRAIHDPIPQFHTELSGKVERFFDHIKPEYPVVRYNWSLQANAQWAQHPDQPRAVIQPDTELYYRCERQSLRRLPETGAIAFTIRVYVYPLHTLAATPDALPRLLAAIRQVPPALADYKGFPRFQAALEKYT